ncbi:hypothetical protein M422DRAFT_257597 [Sphaerobolus stellatus SS14]|uniref:Uncharacterized protein n=1 Tax=Sphaerobolus stellatus (strain SS14) TaxID=990650 RepID=A0A0C9VNC7_SPHS4|nr:hypothetical protein M422DRAFT_257597 [Sphaerobolus stellatus SS14]
MSTHNTTNQSQATQFASVRDTVKQAYEEVHYIPLAPPLSARIIKGERDSIDLENAIIAEKTREWLSIPPQYPLQPSQFPITQSLDVRAHTLATTHRYPSGSLNDLSDEELSVMMDPVSQEALRHVIQSEAANNALKIALARRDYASVTSFVLGQMHRFKTILAQAQILRAAHYERLRQEDYIQEQLVMENFGEDFAREYVNGNSAALELQMDNALIFIE